jgi:hypothetical protein
MFFLDSPELLLAFDLLSNHKLIFYEKGTSDTVDYQVSFQ